MNKGLNTWELSANQLKWMALITMTLDHFGKMFVVDWISPIASALCVSEYGVYLAYTVLFAAGHLTIYIFLWFVAEGCRYTHNPKAYIGRLILFGLLAEIPFQYMIHIILGSPLSLQIGFTNVMFTLALGAVSCYGYRLLHEWGYRILSYFVPVVCAVIAYLLKTDYDFFGVICIFLLYIVKDRNKQLGILLILILVFGGLYIPLTDMAAYGFDLHMLPVYVIELLFSLLAVWLLSMYHGKRGKVSKTGKYFFYLYYPLHISILVFLYSWAVPLN